MWRLQVTPLASSAAIRMQWLPMTGGRRMSSTTTTATSAGMFRRITPYGLTIPMGCRLSSSSSSTMSSSASAITNIQEAKRFFRAQSRPAEETAQSNTSSNNTTSSQNESGAADGKDQKTAEEGAKKEGGEAAGGETAAPEQTGIKAQIDAFKRDFHQFPDIYNSANAINFILFTIFCLCSTGSNVEAEWWINQFGIDAAFRPLAWFMHSVVMNNFLSMTFAMMLLHSMCHSVLPTIGSAALFQYCAIISVVSGVAMWAFNYSIGYTKEKQFGPWDIVAGLFVMQFLHQGFLPWQIINSFNGWVRYACWVGAVCILYYDPQPTALGTAMGFALCKFHPRFKVGAAAAAGAK
ncbi:transmembrane protein, putative [Bodo saltans]|uniref:Transmembrane protein, putative n=1 Tax=Bodo saltans TaxID=75058 RepID=A0A0S4ILW7_BODSA|nr:transmembrane protein, putative [Bodo saltans]|eukprot:CUE72174.1 transmembrane protein, putative [Bodo saltans]